MENEFVSYTQALALKELGFDEFCFGYYRNYGTNKFYIEFIHRLPERFRSTKAPLYQQAFRFFREKHGLLHDITLTLNINDELESFYILIHKLNGLVINEDDDIELNVKTTNKEEAESACLDKLIEICKTKTNE